MATMTTPTPPLDLSTHDAAGVAGTLHTPDPAAVERLKRLMAEQQSTRHDEAERRRDSGDRITANLRRAAEAVNARRRLTLTDAQMADVEARRVAGETWVSIANAYHVVHTTLTAAMERGRVARRHKETGEYHD